MKAFIKLIRSGLKWLGRAFRRKVSNVEKMEYPKYLYKDGEAVLVESIEAHDKLKGYAESPAEVKKPAKKKAPAKNVAVVKEDTPEG